MPRRKKNPDSIPTDGAPADTAPVAEKAPRILKGEATVISAAVRKTYADRVRAIAKERDVSISSLITKFLSEGLNIDSEGNDLVPPLHYIESDSTLSDTVAVDNTLVEIEAAFKNAGMTIHEAFQSDIRRQEPNGHTEITMPTMSDII